MIHEHVPPKDDRPCICRICICGQHDCPGISHMRPFNGLSSYTEHYPAKEVPLDRSTPRARAIPHPTKAAPGHFQTTHQLAFDPIRDAHIEKSSPFRPKDNPVPRADFNGTTTQRTDYIEHPLEHQPRSSPKQAMQPRKGVGTYETTNQAMQSPVVKAYKEGTVQLPTLSRLPESMHPDGAPFDGTTSYQEHYPPKASDLPTKQSPRSFSIPRAPENRDFLTTNGAAYVAPVLKKRLPCPAAVAPRRPPSSDGHIKVTEKIDLEKYAEYYTP